LDELRNQYIDIGIQIARTQLEQSGLSYDIEQLLQVKRDLEDRVKTLGRYDHIIKNLNHERGDIGLLEMGKRIDHEEKIMSMKAKKSGEAKKLYNDYQIKPDGIPGKWQSVDRDLTMLQDKIKELPEKIAGLEGQQKEIGQEYRVVHSREPEDARNTASKSRGERPDKNASLNDRMAITKAENELENLTKPIQEQEHTHEHRRERKQR